VARPRPIIYVVREAKKGFKGKNWKATAYIDGRRKQHWFDSKAAAVTFANDKNGELTAYGSRLSDLSASERADSQRALEILRSYPGVTLTDLAREYVRQAEMRSASKPLDLFLDEYQAQIQSRVDSGENRPGSLKAIKETFVKLKAEFGSRTLSDITPQELERWLDRMSVALRTKKRHRGYALQIFNAAKRRKLIVSNPVEEIEAYRGKKNDEGEIRVLTPEQVTKLLASADAEIRPLYAIATFAGVRWEEIEKMTWEDIKENEIVIGARIAKGRSRRIVPIRSTLAAFLVDRREGSVLPRIYTARRPSKRRLDSLRAKAEEAAGLLPWPRNCFRHSFISYALATEQNENKIALESGNSTRIIHDHYRALVTKEAAEKFWAIAPKK